jgi:long-chain acyl-CoA synthetase
MVLENGQFRIIDRAKNIFKLSHGEYIAPEKLENVYVQSKYVLQVGVFLNLLTRKNFVHGESIKSSLIAVVVPDPEVLLPWAKETGKEEDLEKLCSDPEVNKLIFDVSSLFTLLCYFLGHDGRRKSKPVARL